MPRKIVSVVVLSVLLALIFAGNSGNVAISAGNSNPAASPGAAQPVVETFDDRLAEVAMQVPGFASMYYDEDGTLKVLTTEEPTTEPAAEALTASLEAVIASGIGRGERLSHKGVEFLKAKYDFLSLHSWHQQMSPEVLNRPEVVYTDIDDKTGMIEIGFDGSSGIEATLAEYLSKMGIPSDAVRTRKTKPVHQELRNFRRPLRGGLQINFGNFLCTLGFIADRQGVRGFVTNSHCTNVQGGVEGTVYHQPSASGTTNRVGQEIADPTYFTGGSCPAGRRCRFSDSSFARVPHPSGPAVSTVRGSIARPPVGSFTWNGVNTFTITAEAAPVVGQAITKVGRTTGRTTGTVQQTCANFNVSGSNITQLCQSRGSFASAGGDSGSPVFRITALPNVTLVGIHWGSGGVFSPITGIQMAGELGAVTTCSAGGC